ncbi:MAG: hypothetical protein HKN82_11190, partial [Akkermansiaceae bacterium]|nr:hypothetical protein [Akkermansiaceae bacterium]
FRKKKSADGPDPLSKREEQLLTRIAELESFIEEGPDRIRREIEEEITTMPPPDDLVDRRREYEFYTKLSRGEIRNERRYQAKSAILFVLLAAAIAALSSWIYTFLNGI